MSYGVFKKKLEAMDVDELRRQRAIAPLTAEEALAVHRGSVLNERVQWVLMIRRELDDRLDALEP